MEKEICPQCLGSKEYMTEKVPGKKKGLEYRKCNICDDNGMIIQEDYFEETELNY